MMIRLVLPSLTLLLFLANTSEAARILGLFPFPSKSHFNAFANLLEELAKRGHEMTVISAYPRSPPLPNYTDIPIDDYIRRAEDVDYFEKREAYTWTQFYNLFTMMTTNCARFLNYPQIQELLKSKKEFDLIIFEVCFSECAYCFMHRFKVPFIQVSSNMIGPWTGDGVGNPNFFSYIPELSTPFTHHMTFKERLTNSLLGAFSILIRAWLVIPTQERIMKTYYPDPNAPSVTEIENNASFLLINSHISITYPRPLTPNTAEVGGMHIKEPKKLRKDLQKFLDDAPDGVIYFSLGSHIRSNQMPESVRKVFLQVFSKLKQKVLWKWENESLPGQPKNVKIGKWLPQNDILAHPNVKLFMTHGGILSVQEATYHGVPLVAIPIFGDQHANSHRAEVAGAAVRLDLNNITGDCLTWALNEVLTNPRYGEKAKQLSNIFRDQPMKPLDQAVFWVEYVLRHRGAPHMKLAASKLSTFQYYALDCIAFVFLGSIIVYVLILISCNALYRRVKAPYRWVKAPYRWVKALYRWVRFKLSSSDDKKND